MYKKILYTFFIEVPRNPYEICKTLYTFYQQYRRKMYKLRKKYIYTFFRSLHFFSLSNHPDFWETAEHY